MILDLWLNLPTFTFNADWRVHPHKTPRARCHSHANITTIGLHGLSHAFRADLPAEVATRDPIGSQITHRSNDLSVTAQTKLNFSNIQRLMPLTRSMLGDLNEENGPSVENGGYERWNRW
jgi:hypothetical protein